MMKRILELMEQKNHYLEKFYSINETSIQLFLEDRFEIINDFYDQRENILEILKYIDEEISRVSQNTRSDNLPDLEKLKEALKVKDIFVQKIIEQDMTILSCIESAKNSIIKELRDVKKGQKIVSAYKTPSFNKKLEEEI
ncbi:MAG: hypothetical protein KDD45_02900 [Bdellovibrionales bacterium]|nr:hypothetical protein [Bdellovibrionales bacterium]